MSFGALHYVLKALADPILASYSHRKPVCRLLRIFCGAKAPSAHARPHVRRAPLAFDLLSLLRFATCAREMWASEHEEAKK